MAMILKKTMKMKGLSYPMMRHLGRYLLGLPKHGVGRETPMV